MKSNASWLKPFLSGVVAAVGVSQILAQLLKEKKSSKKSTRGNLSDEQREKPESRTIHKNGENIMDSPTLENRILRKAETALQWRTSRLIIVVERCTNDHNYSAILRTAEALGVQHVYIIAPQDRNATLRIGVGGDDANLEIGMNAVADKEPQNMELSENIKLHRSNGQIVKRYSEADVKDRANHHLFAQRALEWIEVTEFDTTKECIEKLRRDGYDIWSTDLSQVAVTLDEEGLTDEESGKLIPDKLAIVFGTEAVGCSTEILEASDKRVYLPLRGFADSLNLSVATALVVHHLFILDPSLIGSMANEERMALRRKWYTKLATQRILTKGQKQKKKRLIGLIKSLEELEHRQKFPESSSFPMHPEQLAKLEKLPAIREELKQFEDEINAKALSAVEDLVNNPPPTVADMRRHDGKHLR